MKRRDIEKIFDGYIEREYGVWDTLSKHEYSSKNQKLLEKLIEDDKKYTNDTDTKGAKIMKAKKRVLVILAAAAVLIVSTFAAYAASPEFRNFIHVHFLQTDSVHRIENVPEGWTGIYSASDLEKIRDDSSGSFILMNDINLTEVDYAESGIFEGGFEPIEMFSGVFNGNGYIISGLIINSHIAANETDVTEYNAGFFGRVKQTLVKEDEATGEQLEYYGTCGGVVKNLGVTDSVINVEFESNIPVRVGGIAGYADFLVGCYTENLEINVTYTGDEAYTKVCDIGGAAGKTYITDSCFSNASLTADVTPDTENGGALHVGGVAGFSFSCVTSYFSGTMECGEEYDCGVTYTEKYDVPAMLTEDMLNDILDRVEKTTENTETFTYTSKESGEEVTISQDAARISSFYAPTASGFLRDISIDDYLTKDGEGVTLHLLDPDYKPREYAMLREIIINAFPDEDFDEYCRNNNIKCGCYYCYDLRDDVECDFDGFDFGNIWDNDENGVRLKLFTGGTYA